MTAPPRRLVGAVLGLMALATAAATGIGLWLSYEALHTYAGAHRLTGPQAWAWPAAVDLFVIVGELGWFVSIVNQRPDWFTRALVLVGFGASLGFNVADAGPAMPDRFVAAVPPCAALLALAALMRQLHRHANQRTGAAVPGPARTGPADHPEPVDVPPDPADDGPPAEAIAGDVDELARRVYRDSIAADAPLSERQLASRFGKGRSWARRIVREAGAGERVIALAERRH